MSDLRIPLDYKEKDLPRAAWNLSCPVITSLMQGLNVPMHFEILKPKDDIDSSYRFLLQSMPMVGQLLNNWKLRVFTFKSSLSNYYGWMDNNTRQDKDAWKGKNHHYISPTTLRGGFVDSLKAMYFGSYDYYENDSSLYSSIFMSIVPSFLVPRRKIGNVPPQSEPFESPFSQTYNSARTYFVQGDSLLDMIGVPRGFVSTRVSNDNYREEADYFLFNYSIIDCFNADYILTYLDSVRNYLVNNQYSAVPYLYTCPNVTSWANFTIDGIKPRFGELSLSQIDEFFIKLRLQTNGVDLLKFAYDNGLYEIVNWLLSLKSGGMFCSQYERDMLTTLLYNNNSGEVLVTVDERGNFSINQLRFANRYQKREDRASVAGGRYRDRLRTIWGSDSNSALDIPQLVGVSSYIIDPRGVVTTSDTYNPDTGDGSSVGQLNGVVNNGDSSKVRNSIYSEDDSILMFMVQLVPDVVYCNGLGKGLDIHSFDDEYTPQFDQLGFQDVPLYKYNCLPAYSAGDGYIRPSDYDPTKVVGKNISFIDLISNVGRSHGKLSSDEYFDSWLLKRTFSNTIGVRVSDKIPDGTTDDFTTSIVSIDTPVKGISPYVNPLEYQYPFAVTNVGDPNFVFLFGIELRAVRSKGKQYMPTLGN